MSIDKIHADTLTEQAALSTLRDPAADARHIRQAETAPDIGVDEALRKESHAATLDAVRVEPEPAAAETRDPGDRLLASNAWQGTPSDVRGLLDRSEMPGLGRPDLAQAVDDAVTFVLQPPK